MSSEIVSSDRAALKEALEKAGTGRKKPLEQLYYYSSLVNAFPPLDHPHSSHLKLLNGSLLPVL